jgi:hypothetical protein
MPVLRKSSKPNYATKAKKTKKTNTTNTKSLKVNTYCPNLKNRKATAWSRFDVQGKPMYVKTCCTGCVKALKQKLMDGKIKKSDLNLVPATLDNLKQLQMQGEKVRTGQLGGFSNCNTKSSNNLKGGFSNCNTKSSNNLKGGFSNCNTKSSNNLKGGAVRAGTVVQNMPVRNVVH